MKNIKIEIKSIFGKILFTYESENATIREAVEKAISENIDLRYADLSYANLSSTDLSSANLRSANLSSANLRSTDLRYANLRYANLRSTDLSYANLRYTDLSYANLRYTDLSYANLRSANLSSALNKETSCLPLFCKWGICIIGDTIKIGCKEKSIQEWDLFFSSNEEFETKRGTEEFKQIEASYLAYKAYLTHLSK